MTSWQPSDLDPYLDGNVELPRPTIFGRTDGHSILYRGRRHVLVGRSGSGKTLLILAAAGEVLSGGGTVLFIDFEDDAPAIIGRLRSLGVEPEAIRERFHYVRPEAPAIEGDVSSLVEKEYDLVIIDGVTEAMAMHGLSPRYEDDVANLYAVMATPFSSAGAAVVLIDHTPHDGEREIGSQHKRAGSDVSLLMRSEGWRPGTEAWGDLDVLKDRPGGLDWTRERGRKRLARIHVVPVEGGTRIDLLPPTGMTNERHLAGGIELRPSLRGVVEALTEGPATVAQIAARMHKAEPTVRERLRELAALDEVEELSGDRDASGRFGASRWALPRWSVMVEGASRSEGSVMVDRDCQRPQVGAAMVHDGTAMPVVGEPDGAHRNGRIPGSIGPGTVTDADVAEEPETFNVVTVEEPVP